MLSLINIKTGYDSETVLDDVSMSFSKGERVGIIGPNGSGKSTVLKAIFGIHNIWSGEINFLGREVSTLSPQLRFSEGIVFGAQDTRVFPHLSVLENLNICINPQMKNSFRPDLDEFLALYPSIKPLLGREASCLSGGEQQLVALGRCFLARPKLLLLDEPSLGLSPKFQEEVFRVISKISDRRKMTAIIVEHNLASLFRVCHRVYALKNRNVFFAGKPDELSKNSKLQNLFS